MLGHLRRGTEQVRSGRVGSGQVGSIRRSVSCARLAHPTTRACDGLAKDHTYTHTYIEYIHSVRATHCEGCTVGALVGRRNGCSEGWHEGRRLGCPDGWPEGVERDSCLHSY